jgi:hypothetical protein
MWEDILKVQVLGSKQKVKQGIKPLPKAEKNDCIKWLKGLYDVFELNSNVHNFTNNTITDWDKIPEHIACKIKHYLETQPAYEIDSEYHTNNKGVDLYSDKVLGIQFYFKNSIFMYINLNLNYRTVLNMVIHTSWNEFFTNSMTDLDGGYGEQTFDTIKEICKYIGREDVWDYFIDYLDGKSRDNPEHAGLYNSWLDEGKLDW